MQVVYEEKKEERNKEEKKKNIRLWGWGVWFVHFKPFKVLFEYKRIR